MCSIVFFVIPYSTQDINEADVRAVVKTLKSGFITQGPAIERFEKTLAKKVGAKYCVAFNSGTAALHAAYFAAGVKEGDEVLMPAMTFAATGNAALYLGATPVFADIDLSTYTMSVEDARKKITKKTKVIVPVDYAGRPADLSAFRALARKHKLVLIEDGAQSLGARYKGKPIGTQADMTMFSFHPVKSITTGEGGVIVTNNAHYARQMRLFRSHGITRDEHFVKKSPGPWHQEMHALGFNYRITDIQAALGKSQLKRLDEFIKRRRLAAARYPSLLKGLPIILPPKDTKDTQSAWHLYAVRVDAKKRKQVFEYLRKVGIGVQVHYLPVYLHPYYQKLGYKKGLCPNAELFYLEEISLPIFARITPAQQKKVASALSPA